MFCVFSVPTGYYSQHFSKHILSISRTIWDVLYLLSCILNGFIKHHKIHKNSKTPSLMSYCHLIVQWAVTWPESSKQPLLLMKRTKCPLKLRSYYKYDSKKVSISMLNIFWNFLFQRLKRAYRWLIKRLKTGQWISIHTELAPIHTAPSPIRN